MTVRSGLALAVLAFLAGCSESKSSNAPGPGNTSDGAVDGASVPGDGGDAPDVVAPPSCAAVTLAFEGTVTTVAKNPLGLDASVRDTAVSGSFAYRPCVNDSDKDPKRGVYEHISGADFSLSVGGLAIGGSGKARVEVENFDPDTIRWRDGKILADPITRTMTVDDAGAPSLQVLIAITDGSGAALTSDKLPTSFPFLNIAAYPHTFSVEDTGGTLLLQLSAMTQR